MKSTLERFQVPDEIHGQVPCTALVPAASGQHPLCLLLYGGGGNPEMLAGLQPQLEQGWASGALPPMLVATPGVGSYSFYLDDAARGLGWESFVADRFIANVRERFATSHATALVGLSMGGYGALKLAFARPSAYTAVAAVSPMIEPAYEADQVRPRNRYFYPPDVPQALLGPTRDAALYRSDSPVARVRRQAALLREAALGIYLDAGGSDLLAAHDGAEFLHRVLWDLDIAHDYRLRDGSDHGGPDLPVRVLDAFSWVGERVAPRPAAPLSDLERAWASYLDGQRATPPSVPPDLSSPLFLRMLRAQLSDARRRAQLQDPSVARRYGALPPVEDGGSGRP